MQHRHNTIRVSVPVIKYVEMCIIGEGVNEGRGGSKGIKFLPQPQWFLNNCMELDAPSGFGLVSLLSRVESCSFCPVPSPDKKPIFSILGSSLFLSFL